MATGKRSRDNAEDAPEQPPPAEDDDSSSSDDDVGPALPSAAPPKKKRKTLPHEETYIAALPLGTRYSRSLMHKDDLFSATFTSETDFLITASVDGQVNFWKKGAGGEHVEFVKEFKAHNAELTGNSASWDGRHFASCGLDNTVKIWDVINFELMAVLKTDKPPSCVCWVHARARSSRPVLAVGNQQDGEIAIWDGTGAKSEPNLVLKKVHRQPVACMAYNADWDCVVSSDEGGMMEYWTPAESTKMPDGLFEFKSQTDLYAFKKSKTVPTSITFSPNGRHFATFSMPDRKVRVFTFKTGKVYRSYDESIQNLEDMQQAETAPYPLDDKEFARRIAVERDLDDAVLRKRINVVFDETGYFIIYGSLYGSKVVNLTTDGTVRVYGGDEPLRSLHHAVYQGAPDKKAVVSVEMAASNNPLLAEAEARDAMLVTTAISKARFYMYTNQADVELGSRDILNERPTAKDGAASKAGNGAKDEAEERRSTKAVIFTTYGDIHVRLFPDAAPKTVENFVGHAKSGYYKGIVFHRVIRKFMIQTGDPLGDGTGGESIWGGEFADEFSGLRHDRPYTLSMANAGPNTNASQFFITTEKTPWLDNKHTIFGRATAGFDVIHKIENAKAKKERPLDDIRIINIGLKDD